MVLADTSVWIDHLRKGQPDLAALLREGAVASHSFVIGELACGNLANRAAFFAELSTLPRVLCSTHEEALQFIDTRKLWGRGSAGATYTCWHRHCFPTVNSGRWIGG